MIKLLNSSKAMVALLSQLKDFSVESDLASADKLIRFKVPKSAISRSLLLQEYYLLTATDEYVIKEINTSDDEFHEVFGKLSLDSLRGKTYLTYASDTVTLATVLGAITAGTGWTYQLVDVNTKQRSLSLTNATVYSIILECCTVYGMEVYFDTINKIVKCYTTRGTNRGAYVYSELNLRDRDYQSDTYELATRLYPYGKDGLTVASVNGGLAYIDNSQYTTKIIERRWVDDRYTDAQSLYDDAAALLAKISKPRVSFQIDVMNLVGSRPEYNILDFQLGDTVKIIDKSNQIMDTQRIVRLVEYPLTPEKNKVDFSNSAIKYSGSNAKQIADIEQNLSSTKSELSLAIDQVTELIINGENGYVITRYDAQNKPIEILIMNTADISTATKVWRWNINGLGYSSNGYNGPYSTAITMNGQIVADFINTGTLNAGLIKSGSLQSVDGSSWVNMANGTFSFGSGAIAWNGSALTANGSFTASGGTQLAKIDGGSLRLLNSGVELGFLSIQTAGPTGPWLTAAAGATTIRLAKVVGTSLYTAYKIDWGSTGGTVATHNFWGTTTFNGHPLSCGALTSGGIAADGVITCWRVEPHLDNNDRCGTATKRWQAVHAFDGYFSGIMNVNDILEIQSVAQNNKVVFDHNAGGFSQATVRPNADNTCNLGSSTYTWGYAAITTVSSGSARRRKENIQLFDEQSAYEQLKSIPIYAFAYKHEEFLDHQIGTLIEYMPVDLLDTARPPNSISGQVEHWSLGSGIWFGLAVSKVLQQKIEALEQRISGLEGGIV